MKLITEEITDVQLIAEADENGKKTHKIKVCLCRRTLKIEMVVYIHKRF